MGYHVGDAKMRRLAFKIILNNCRNSLKMIKFKVQRIMLEAKLKGTRTKWGIVKLCSSIGGFCDSKTERERKKYCCKKKNLLKATSNTFPSLSYGCSDNTLGLSSTLSTCCFLSITFSRVNAMSSPPDNNSPIVLLHRNSSRGASSSRVVGKTINPCKTPPWNLCKSGCL